MTKKQITFVVVIVSMIAIQTFLAVGVVFLKVYNIYVNSSNVVDNFFDSGLEFENGNLESSSIFNANVKNNNGKIFEVKVLARNGIYEIMDFPSYLGNSGDTIITGKLDITISD